MGNLNYYKGLAKLLGLYWDEEKQESEVFNIKALTNKFRITREGTQCFESFTWEYAPLNFNFLKPENIVKIPWVPEEGEACYYPQFAKQRLYHVMHWGNDYFSKRIQKAVGIYRTPEEAQAKAKEMWGL